MANILLKTIISLKKEIVNKINTGGILIASGIKKNQKDEAINTFKNLGLNLQNEFHENEWTALIFNKP